MRKLMVLLLFVGACIGALAVNATQEPGKASFCLTSGDAENFECFLSDKGVPQYYKVEAMRCALEHRNDPNAPILWSGVF